MALTINNISSQTSINQAQKTIVPSGKTTITPFSEVLKQEKEAAKAASSAKSEQAAGSPSVTSGTTGSKNADGSLKTTLEDIFKRASEKYGVPYNFLVAVAKAESNFNLDSVSHAGAQGIMQLMPETAKDLGVKDAFDAEQNIMGAAKLLAAHLDKFDGDTTLAAAAYNAGSGRVQQYGGVPPFTETQNYVKKIASYMEEGVDVPDKTVTVHPNKLSGDVTKSQGSGTSAQASESKTVPGAVAATEAELNNSMIVVGKGEGAITMTYGAYQRYLELGDLGVG